MTEYWEGKYAGGGPTCFGSSGKMRDRKWSIIEKVIGVPQDVIDLGCGPLTFWEDRDCDFYMGLDISKTVIEENKKKRKRWMFLTGKAESYNDLLGFRGAETVLCLDVLFHIMDGLSFYQILLNLCKYSKKNIVIFTWDRNPFSRLGALRRLDIRGFFFPSVTDGKFQYFRRLEEWWAVFVNEGFKLIHKERVGPYGAFYFYQKRIKDTE